MRAMILNTTGQPLEPVELPVPQPGKNEVLIRVTACGVCRTDLHLVDGELPDIHVPVIPGHEIVGEVVDAGPDALLEPGMRVGIPWLGWTCGDCVFCRIHKENLCEHAKFTGYQLDGGYCEYTTADYRYCIPVDNVTSAEELAPLLCAGLIGYRCLKIADTLCLHNEKIGLFGFGAAAHILAQIIIHRGSNFFAFTRPHDLDAQQFAYRLGATWAGGSDQVLPDRLDCAIIFAPTGNLVPCALHSVRKGGAVVCGGIHMSDIPSFPYASLWGERQISSVANLTRKDGTEFFEALGQIPVQTHIHRYPLSEANRALEDLRHGKLNGAAVLMVRE